MEVQGVKAPPSTLLNEIAALLVIKQRAGEAEYGPRRPATHAFIEAELRRGETPPSLPVDPRADVAALDVLLYQAVMAWA